MQIVFAKLSELKKYKDFEKFIFRNFKHFLQGKQVDISKQLQTEVFEEKLKKLKLLSNDVDKVFQYVDFLTKTKSEGTESDYTTSLLNQLRHVNMKNMCQIDKDFLQWVVPKLPHIDTQSERFKLFYESFYRVHFPDYANILTDGMRKIVDYKADEYTRMSPYEYSSQGAGLVNPLKDEYTLPKGQAFNEGVGLQVSFNWMEPGIDNRVFRGK